MSKSKHRGGTDHCGTEAGRGSGRTVEDVARECGVSMHTIYPWKAKYGGLEVNEAQRPGSLGGSEPGSGDAQDGDCKKRPELVDRRADASWLQKRYGASERRVCGLVSMAVSSFRYRSRRSDEFRS